MCREVIMIGTACIFFFLGIHTWEDVRKQEISVKKMICFGILGIGYLIFFRKPVLGELLCSLLPGMLLLLLGRITSQAVGYGDGWVILILGLFLAPAELLGILGLASALAGIWALYLVVRKRKDQEIPFLPFLLLGFAGGVLL